MITFSEGTLSSLIVHRIGHQAAGEYMVLSEQALTIQDDVLARMLLQYFLLPFEKTNEVYRFSGADFSGTEIPDAEKADAENTESDADFAGNEVYTIASTLFNQPDGFHAGSIDFARRLYALSDHPKAKAGELYVAYFNNLQIEGELHEAIGLFKSETKESFLKITPVQGGFALGYEEGGISLNKLDKGCLIFNTEKEKGYKVAAMDTAARSSENSWKDDFLKLSIRNDEFNQTQNVLGVYKRFVSEKLDEEFEISKTDKIDLLNRSMKYFKEKEQFDIDEFSEEVIGNEQGIALFKDYKKSYEAEFDAPIADNFDISEAAVKKQARIFKSILKLDKNFHIYIHGNKELIEKGFDQEKSMNYYKVFFRDEQ